MNRSRPQAIKGIQDFDLGKPLDVKTAVEALRKDTKIYFTFCARMEVCHLNARMQEITTGYNSKDWK